MKTWLIPLTLLCAAALAQAADDMPDANPAPAAETAPAPAQPQARAPQRKFTPRSHADLRHCLDLNSNEAIIRCAEKQRRR